MTKCCVYLWARLHCLWAAHSWSLPCLRLRLQRMITTPLLQPPCAGREAGLGPPVTTATAALQAEGGTAGGVRLLTPSLGCPCPYEASVGLRARAPWLLPLAVAGP
jgi:hypothetical protein